MDGAYGHSAELAVEASPAGTFSILDARGGPSFCWPSEGQQKE